MKLSSRALDSLSPCGRGCLAAQAARRVRGLSPQVKLAVISGIEPLIRRHSRSSASAFSRTAAKGRLRHLLPQGEKEEQRSQSTSFNVANSVWREATAVTAPIS